MCVCVRVCACVFVRVCVHACVCVRVVQINYMQIKQTSNISTHAKAIGVTPILYNDIISAAAIYRYSDIYCDMKIYRDMI